MAHPTPKEGTPAEREARARASFAPEAFAAMDDAAAAADSATPQSDVA
jgi:hypothetical protein